MKNIFLLISILFLFSCSEKEKDNSTLNTTASEGTTSLVDRNPKFLKKDKEELDKNINSYKELFYRFAKIALRSSIEKDTISAEFVAFKSGFGNLTNKLTEYESKEELGARDFLNIYRDYRTMKKFVLATDEDIFPTLTDVFNTKDEGGQINKDYIHLTGNEKIKTQNGEHAVLSVFALFTKDLGTGIALYEASKTNPKLFPEGEERALLQFFRAFLFGTKGFYYLSEEELSQNIQWLDNNPNVNFKLTKTMLGWEKLSAEQTQLGFHSLNHLFRGLDRVMMDTKADKQLGLQDFEVFLADAQKLGLNNELTWAVESYVYINQEEPEKAIASLTKLKTSNYLSSKEKRTIDEAIEYLGKRESGKMLNTVYDKVFLGKIVSTYIFNRLAEVNWKQVMQDQNIPYSKELIETHDAFNDIFNNTKNFTDLDLEAIKDTGLETAKKAGKELEKGGKQLWEKAKGILN